MNTTAVILLVLLLIYIPLWILVLKHPSAIKHGFEKYGPTIKINSRFGLKFIDRFGRYHRFWTVFGIVSQVISLILMLMMIYIMVVAVINLPASFNRESIGVEYILAIPGLNPLLPFWYGLIALIIALVCHEMAHGLQSRSNNIGVKHTGLLYAVVPLGAFVEPDQADVEKSSRRAKLDLYTAGISTNFILAMVAFLVMSPIMLGGLSSPYADNCAVYQEVVDSPADEAGIPAGAILTYVNGSEFTLTSEYQTSAWLGWTPGDLVTVDYLISKSASATTTVRLGTYVQKVVEGSPAEGAGLEGKWISSMEYNGTTYYFYTAQGFSNFMKITHANESITVNTVASDGSVASITIDMGNNSGIGYLGVYTTTSGMSLITPDDLLNAAINPFEGATGFKGYATAFLSYVSHPLSGFDPIPDNLEWWYGDVSDGFWIVCKILFWIFWINLMLGITNAIPAFPFDGGYVFLGWVDAILEKRGNKDREAREKQAFEIARNVSSLMLFLYLLVIIAAVM